MLAALGCMLTLVMSQTTAPVISDVIHRPVCVIPLDQQIGVKDLPRSEFRLDWMSKVASTSPLSLISIPATHDAGTALGRLGGTRCQVFDIPAQLALGVRGFDIRLCVVKNDLRIFHSIEDQKLRFKDVMSAMTRFLKDHPSECIVMRVREENKAIRSTEAFEEAFGKHVQGDIFYKATSRTEIPTLGQLRGKILIWDNYGKLPDAVAYPNAVMSVQDDYDQSDMDKKYHEIEAKFEDALAEKSGATWHVNYTSSCNDVVNQLQNAVAVNPKVDAYLTGKKGHLGLVLFNFPSVDMIHKVIDSNF